MEKLDLIENNSRYYNNSKTANSTFNLNLNYNNEKELSSAGSSNSNTCTNTFPTTVSNSNSNIYNNDNKIFISLCMRLRFLNLPSLWMTDYILHYVLI